MLTCMQKFISRMVDDLVRIHRYKMMYGAFYSFFLLFLLIQEKTQHVLIYYKEEYLDKDT